MKRILPALLLLVCMTFCLFGCTKKTDYFTYVSEHRSNLLLGETDDFSLRVYAIEKEYPFQADGKKSEMGTISEFYLTAPSSSLPYALSFLYDGQTYGGECSYDAVKGRYYLSCPINLSTVKGFSVEIKNGENSAFCNVVSVLQNDTLSGKEVLQKLSARETTLFTSLTDNGVFHAEIYLRVLYEEKVYYYVGIATKSGKIYAYLLDGTTGETVAKREN